jgi:hypothetical protein
VGELPDSAEPFVRQDPPPLVSFAAFSTSNRSDSTQHFCEEPLELFRAERDRHGIPNNAQLPCTNNSELFYLEPNSARVCARSICIVYGDSYSPPRLKSL